VNQGVLAWVCVILGTLLVGGGGLLATFGWNKLRAEDQRRNALVGVAREVRLNDRMIKQALNLVVRWPKRAESDNFSYEAYRKTHVSAALTSGLLRVEKVDDADMLQALEGYEAAISRFNAALRIVGLFNPGIFIRTDLIHAQPNLWPANCREAMAAPFEALINEHERTMSVLQRRYNYAFQKAGFATEAATPVSQR
jgi:hypothetical protein